MFFALKNSSFLGGVMRCSSSAANVLSLQGRLGLGHERWGWGYLLQGLGVKQSCPALALSRAPRVALRNWLEDRLDTGSATVCCKAGHTA